MPSLATIIMIAIGAFLGWSGTYGILKTTHAIQLSRAVKAERDEGVRVCNARVEDIARKTREEAARRAAEAEEAASGVSRTPEEKEALQALCARSASCREREMFK